MNNQYIDTKEAAKMLGYSQGYVSKLCRDGIFNITAIKEGRTWKIPVSAVEIFQKRKNKVE